ncbi:hypothetical protein EJ08DRAFT_571714, partial [Tothia fuscella]
FFRIGKVFKALCYEPAGNGLPSRSQTVSETSQYIGEGAITRIRWFVVVGEGPSFCACLPIQTYSRQGVSSTRLTKNHHSIIHTGERPPPSTLLKQPNAKNGESGMRQPIQVRPNHMTDKLDQISRLCYEKVYTVEHNVKVCDFGDV